MVLKVAERSIRTRTDDYPNPTLSPEVIQNATVPFVSHMTKGVLKIDWRVQIICFIHDPLELQHYPFPGQKLSRTIGSHDGFLKRGTPVPL